MVAFNQNEPDPLSKTLRAVALPFEDSAKTHPGAPVDESRLVPLRKMVELMKR